MGWQAAELQHRLHQSLGPTLLLLQLTLKALQITLRLHEPVRRATPHDTPPSVHHAVGKPTAGCKTLPIKVLEGAE